ARQGVVGDEELPDRVLERRARALPEPGEGGDEAEPDHQRGRGRGGAARVAGRILARERARCAADACSRPAEREGKRPHEERREEGDPEEEEQTAAAEREQPTRRGEAVPEDAVDEEQDADGEDDEPGCRAEAGQPRARQHDALAVVFASDFTCTAALFTCAVGGSSGRSSRTSSSAETPALVARRMRSSLPRLSRRYCAVGRSSTASVPIEEKEASFAIPEIR